MASSKRWMCDGVPKNGKKYPGLGEPHGLYENDSNYCSDCGLPRESSISGSPPFFTTRNVTILAVVAIVALTAGITTVLQVLNRCEPGLEKREGKCIDPFLQPYENAIGQGDEAIKVANEYKTLADLEQNAEPLLVSAIEQLGEIPSEALIYLEAKAKLEEYDQIRQKINYKIRLEKVAQRKLQEVETITQVAQGQTEIAETIPQLTAAKEKWQEAQNKLEEIDNTPLITSKIKQHQSEHEQQIKLIDEKIKQIKAEQIKAEQNRLRNRPQKTYKHPRVVTPTKKKSLPRQNYPTNPNNIPYDPCAVENPPPNCLF